MIKKIKKWLFDALGWTPFEIKLRTHDGKILVMRGWGNLSIYGDIDADIFQLYITKAESYITIYGNLIGGTNPPTTPSPPQPIPIGDQI